MNVAELFSVAGRGAIVTGVGSRLGARHLGSAGRASIARGFFVTNIEKAGTSRFGSNPVRWQTRCGSSSGRCARRQRTGTATLRPFARWALPSSISIMQAARAGSSLHRWKLPAEYPSPCQGVTLSRLLRSGRETFQYASRPSRYYRMSAACVCERDPRGRSELPRGNRKVATGF